MEFGVNIVVGMEVEAGVYVGAHLGAREDGVWHGLICGCGCGQGCGGRCGCWQWSKDETLGRCGSGCVRHLVRGCLQV